VRWPAGETQVIQDPPIDRVLVIKEGEGIIRQVPFRK